MVLQAKIQTIQTINSGISIGSKKGTATAARTKPTKTRQPRTISPTPAKTKASSIATQKRITAVNTALRAVPRGPVIARPFIVTKLPYGKEIENHKKNTTSRIARIKASFFSIISLHLLIICGIIADWMVPDKVARDKFQKTDNIKIRKQNEKLIPEGVENRK